MKTNESTDVRDARSQMRITCTWGLPSRFCPGEEKASPLKQKIKSESTEQIPHTLEGSEENHDTGPDNIVIKDLTEELKQLELEEQALKNRHKVDALRREISLKKESVAELRRDSPQKIEAQWTSPLDQLLESVEKPQVQQNKVINQPASFSTVNFATIGDVNAEQATSEMFLRPARMANGEKILYIVDFIDNIIPSDEEETLSRQGTARIVVTYMALKNLSWNMSRSSNGS